jgi:hypothetical protein
MNSQTENNSKPILIARCKWCVKRIGRPRYRIKGEWKSLAYWGTLEYEEYSGADFSVGNPFTDGICPECYELQTGRKPTAPTEWPPRLAVKSDLDDGFDDLRMGLLVMLDRFEELQRSPCHEAEKELEAAAGSLYQTCRQRRLASTPETNGRKI